VRGIIVDCPYERRQGQAGRAPPQSASQGLRPRAPSRMSCPPPAIARAPGASPRTRLRDLRSRDPDRVHFKPHPLPARHAYLLPHARDARDTQHVSAMRSRSHADRHVAIAAADAAAILSIPLPSVIETAAHCYCHQLRGFHCLRLRHPAAVSTAGFMRIRREICFSTEPEAR